MKVPVISYISRSSVTFQHGNREAKISGEMLLPARGQPGFVLYRSSIRGWEPPYDEEPLDDATKAWILSQAIRILTNPASLSKWSSSEHHWIPGNRRITVMNQSLASGFRNVPCYRIDEAARDRYLGEGFRPLSEKDDFEQHELEWASVLQRLSEALSRYWKRGVGDGDFYLDSDVVPDRLLCVARWPSMRLRRADDFHGDFPWARQCLRSTS